jgi:hypothetical protein
MRKIIEFSLGVFILFFCISILCSYSFAGEVDISINKITFPARIYLNKKATIEIIVVNNSSIDINDCLISVEAEDGSKTSQVFPLNKNDKQKIELKWVPQKKGELKFTAMIKPPDGIQETNTENNKVTKTIEVLP